MRVGDPVPRDLARATVLTRDGAPVTLGSFWSGRAALVCFLRHFGCTGCGEHIAELSPRLFELDALGVRTVLVGNGEARYIDGFVERLDLADKKVDVVTDPTLAVFRAAGLVRSWWGTIGLPGLIDNVRTRARGHGFGGIQGDAFQQGGALIVDPEGRVVFFHASARLGGHARAVDLVEACMVMVAKRSTLPLV